MVGDETLDARFCLIMCSKVNSACYSLPTGLNQYLQKVLFSCEV